MEERKGKRYYTMCDLRKGNEVHNVTRASARRLWHYAITEAEKAQRAADRDITWQGDIGLVKEYKQSGHQRYDLAQRGAKARCASTMASPKMACTASGRRWWARMTKGKAWARAENGHRSVHASSCTCRAPTRSRTSAACSRA